MSGKVLFKVNIKKNKKEPCRICNTKTRPCISLIKNPELLETVNSALGLLVSLFHLFCKETVNKVVPFQVSPETRLSKSVCVLCMSLVRLFEEFKRVCYDTQNDLWNREQHLVKDRGSEVVQLLLRAKSTTLPGYPENPQPLVEAIFCQPAQDQDENNYIPMKRMKSEEDMFQEVIEEECHLEEEEDTQSEIFIEDEMVEEHLEDTGDTSLPVRFMCTHINCDRLFETKDEMTEHLETHQLIRARTTPYTSGRRNEKLKEDAYTCQVCTEVFEDIAGLVQHRKVNHFPVKCFLCSIAIPNESFAAHLAQCKRELAKKKGLFQPIIRGAMKIDTTPVDPDTPFFKCGKCHKRYKTADNYKLHAKTCVYSELDDS